MALVGTIAEAGLPPELKNEFSQVQIRRDKNEHYYAKGVDRETHLLRPIGRQALADRFGYDPISRLLGEAAPIESSSPVDQSGEINGLKGELHALAARLDSLSLDNSRLQQEKADLEAEVARLTQTVGSQSDRIDEISQENQAYRAALESEGRTILWGDDGVTILARQERRFDGVGWFRRRRADRRVSGANNPDQAQPVVVAQATGQGGPPARRVVQIDESEPRPSHAGVAVVGAIAMAALGVGVYDAFFKDEGQPAQAQREQAQRLDTLKIQENKLAGIVEQDRQTDQQEHTKIVAGQTRLNHDLHTYGDKILFRLKKLQANENQEKSEAVGSSEETNSGQEAVGQRLTIHYGDGYTNVIAETFPGYSAYQYYQAHLAALRHFGINYISGIGKYQTAGGDWRLDRPGQARWAAGAKQFIGARLHVSQ